MGGTERLSNRPKYTQLLSAGAETETLKAFRATTLLSSRPRTAPPSHETAGGELWKGPETTAPPQCLLRGDTGEAVRPAQGHTASSSESWEDIPAS